MNSFVSSCEKAVLLKKLAIKDRANLELITNGLPLQTTQYSINEEFPWKCEQNKNCYNVHKFNNIFSRPETSLSIANYEAFICSFLKALL